MTKLIIILILIPVIASGCIFDRQQQSSDVILNSPEAEEESQTEEIDTSNWKTYRNEEYGFKFEYPWDFMQGNNNFYSSNYKEDKGNVDFIQEGFRISINFENLVSTINWRKWVARPGGSIGITTYTDAQTNAGHVYIKKISVGKGFVNQWPQDLRFVEINSMSRKKEANIVIIFVSKNEDIKSSLIIDKIIASLDFY